ncbi:protein TPX2-like isoform X2 [Iris pallida]|uniref:Protein TPX2-like isoform X2 n=1 Tax=Iris pallida TaxID=29817 RepID=A0AAX6E651_IRIPA|nr:protein TPX2-like isoform X2 [Iris pallida]
MATPARNPRGKRTDQNSDPNRPLSAATPKKPMTKMNSSTPRTHSAPRAKKSAAATTPRTPAPARGKKPVASSSSSAHKRSRKIKNDEAAGGGGAVEGELEGSSKVRKMRSMVLEEAMSSVPEPGAGRVMHMVKAFERLLSFTKDGDVDIAPEIGAEEGRVVNWALPGLRRRQPRAEETEVSSCFDFSTTPDRSSVDSNGDRLSWGSSTSYGDQRSRSKSTCSSGRSWNSKIRATSQQPFKLRTEQRGKLKEENFLNKMKQMLLEEEKQRIPIAQGLPWTTDNPECLVKPCLKESTEPMDLVLHSDVRAVERAEFDFHVTERLSFIEQIKLERERLRKLEEEEEVRRLRRELVPKAQPMPYFDRPFVPKKSQKTLPKEPSPTVSKEPSPRTLRTHTKKTSVRKSLKLGHGRLREER